MNIPAVHRVVVIDLSDITYTTRHTVDQLVYDTTAGTAAGAWIELRLNDETAASITLPRTIAGSCYGASGIDIRGGGKWAKFFEQSLHRELQHVAAETERFAAEVTARHRP